MNSAAAILSTIQGLPRSPMNTPSHFLMTAAIAKVLPQIPIHRKAFLIGSVAPDLALWLLTAGGIVYYHLILGWELPETFQLMFRELYFHNPFWIALHNLLHAPLLLMAGIVVVWSKRNHSQSIQHWLFWFFVACLFHSVVDILTHANDGPLLLFPLNWSIRFQSPLSYWDPRYHGREFSRFELGLDVLLLFYCFGGGACRFLQSLTIR